jgi:hypothetical protein
MGTSHSVAALQAKLEALIVELRKGDDVLVAEAAKLTKQTIKAGAPARLRGVGKHGATLGVRYTVTKTADEPAALVYATGPWALIEFDTRAHQIPRQRVSARFEGVFGHAVIPGGAEGGVHGKRGVRTRVHHPGTHGKKPWAHGVERSVPLIRQVFVHTSEAALGAIF